MHSAYSPPFTLFLPQGNHPSSIRCQEILRELSGKRLVCLGWWGTQQVVVKVFPRRRQSRRYWQREDRGVRALAARGILTPEILYSGSLAEEQGDVVVLPFLATGMTALQLWQEAADDDARQRLLGAMVVLFAHHHQQGVCQRDLHLGNFMAVGEMIHTLDGADIVVSRREVGIRKALANLALFWAQLDPAYDQLVDILFPGYCRARGWSCSAVLCQQLKNRIAASRRWRREKYLKKIFRDCSAVVRCRDTGRLILCSRRYYTPPVRDFLMDPDPWLYHSATRLLKDGNSSTVATVVVDGHPLVVKRYNSKGFIHGIKRAFRRTRAARSWRNAHLLDFYGINTPEPVALIERQRLAVRLPAYYVAALADGILASDYFAVAAVSDELRHMAAKVASVIKTMHDQRISHGDLKASNIVLTAHGPALMDLDDMQQHRSVAGFAKAARRDVERFLRNWENYPAVAQLFSSLMKGKEARS
ncbi:MAG: hypothetical protein JXO49_06470 [Deltaproteobacteria bacterium]|nr:hypothetical protein [Candidatus Anaeroferrophillus wilburensis]MBN2888971.1 hypothetical protein [Deltaproteobacteria bacterium]